MNRTPYAHIPQDLTFHKEWRRIVFTPDGERVEKLDSNWYEDETLARSLLNSEYPEPTSTGWYMRLQVKWISESRDVDGLKQ